MAKTLHSERHRRLAELIVEKRKRAGLTQAAVASALGRHQPFIANIESGERRVDLVELISLSEVIGFNLCEFVREIEQIGAAELDGNV